MDREPATPGGRIVIRARDACSGDGDATRSGRVVVAGATAAAGAAAADGGRTTTSSLRWDGERDMMARSACPSAAAAEPAVGAAGTSGGDAFSAGPDSSTRSTLRQGEWERGKLDRGAAPDDTVAAATAVGTATEPPAGKDKETAEAIPPGPMCCACGAAGGSAGPGIDATEKPREWLREWPRECRPRVMALEPGRPG